MKLQIAKLRLIGIVAFAAFLFLTIIEKKQIANISLIVALLSFAVVIVLQIYSSYKSGFLKNYLNKDVEEN